MLCITSEHHKIAHAIVVLHSIYVVNNLVRKQVSAKMLFHYQPVFLNVLLFAIVLPVGLQTSNFV